MRPARRIRLASLMNGPLLGGLVVAAATTLSFVGVVACESCRAPNVADQKLEKATFRLYVVSDIAGALEPCGCVKEQAGGLDHAAALVKRDRGDGVPSGVVTVGPTFFLDSKLRPDKEGQEKEKALAIARGMKTMGLLAFAPGANDLAGGAAFLDKIRTESGAEVLATEPLGVQAVGVKVVELGGMRVGFIGLTAQKILGDENVAKARYDDAKKEGAQVVIALAATGRGEAKRIADAVPGLAAVVVGSVGSEGEVNTDTPSGERLGNVVVAQTANHLQAIVALDFFVRGDTAFADASHLEHSRKWSELRQKALQLRHGAASLEQQGKSAGALRAELAIVEGEILKIERGASPAKGSYLQYRVIDVRDSAGKDAKVSEQMLAYYKKVNEENSKAFASRIAPPVAKDQPTYVGIEACSDCHQDARKVWDKTAHAHAYSTLSTQFKEFNLDCVSCHVTGYEQPGGSTVVHVEKLKNVQCETCHGPGSLHVAKPEKVAIPIAHPKPDTCLSCHHPPHVHTFDAPSKVAEILGPGHGRPKP